MTNQRKTEQEYADDYDYNDYIASLTVESPYTAYASKRNSLKEKVTETNKDLGDNFEVRKDRYSKASPNVIKRGHRNYAESYRFGDQRADGTIVVKGGGGYGGRGVHSGSGYGHGGGGGCGGGNSYSIGLCEALSVAGLAAVAAAAFAALYIVATGKRKKRSVGSMFEDFDILKGKTVLLRKKEEKYEYKKTEEHSQGEDLILKNS